MTTLSLQWSIDNYFDNQARFHTLCRGPPGYRGAPHSSVHYTWPKYLNYVERTNMRIYTSPTVHWLSKKSQVFAEIHRFCIHKKYLMLCNLSSLVVEVLRWEAEPGASILITNMFTTRPHNELKLSRFHNLNIITTVNFMPCRRLCFTLYRAMAMEMKITAARMDYC